MFAITVGSRHKWRVKKAFLLGAGLGTRLKPLTNIVPKPLVPFFHRPLIGHAALACRELGIHDLAINSHHLPHVWKDPILGIGASDWKKNGEYGGNGIAVEQGIWEGADVRLFEEPILLETGGGLRNVRKWMGAENVLVHNGDIYSSMDLAALIREHEQSGLPVTIALRSNGVAKHIAIDESKTRVVDIRGKLGRAEGTHVFSGIYCVNEEIFSYLPDEEIVSVIPAFLQLALQNRLGAMVMDQGNWFDLGERNSYLAAHQSLGIGEMIHPLAQIDTTYIVENSAIGMNAIVGKGAIVRNSILWPGARVAADADLDQCIVYSGNECAGFHRNEDL
jgi:NDP-sugar pyrophosphorylase family protein